MISRDKFFAGVSGEESAGLEEEFFRNNTDLDEVAGAVFEEPDEEDADLTSFDE